MSVPISALFVGIHSLIALVLSYAVVIERTKTCIWHGGSETEVSHQPNYLDHPNVWASWVEQYTQQWVATKTADDGLLQRKVRAYGNFTESGLTQKPGGEVGQDESIWQVGLLPVPAE